MRKIYLLFVLMILSLSYVFGQEYSFQLEFNIKSKDYNIEAASYLKVTFHHRSGATQVWQKGLEGKEYRKGVFWRTVHSVKCSVNDPIVKMTVYGEHRDNPTGNGNNIERGNATNIIYFPETEYPCAEIQYGRSFIGKYSNGCFLSLSVRPISKVWAIEATSNQASAADTQNYKVYYSDGSSEVFETNRNQLQRVFYTIPSKSGITKIERNINNIVVASHTFYTPLLAGEHSNVTMSGGGGNYRINFNYSVIDIKELTSSGGLPLDERITLTTNEFHNKHYWVYSTDFFGWQSLPTTFGEGNNVTLSGYDLLGVKALEYAGKPIYFKVYYPWPGSETSILTLNLLLSAPRIVSVTAEDAKCVDTSTGKLRITTDRAALEGEEIEIWMSKQGSFKEKADIIQIDPTTFEIQNIDAGTYSLKIESIYKRVASYSGAINHKKDNIVVREPAPIVFSVHESDRRNISCKGGNDGSFKVTAEGGNGGYMLWWRKQGEANFTPTDNLTVSQLYTGNYEYYITDKNGCFLPAPDGFELIKTVTLTEPERVLSIAHLADKSHDPSGYGLSNGYISVVIDGGTPNYTTQWLDKATGNILTSVTNGIVDAQFESKLSAIPSGSYQLRITDSKGCETSAEFTLNQPDLLVANISQQGGAILCHGDKTVSLSVSVTGGVTNILGGGYVYTWYKQENGSYVYLSDAPAIGNLGAGIYKVVVADASTPANTQELEYTISEPPLLTVTTAGRNISCFDGSDGAINISVSGGVGAYELYYKKDTDAAYTPVLADGSGSNFAIPNLKSGRYEYYVKDANACLAPINGSTIGVIDLTQPQTALVISSREMVSPTGFGRADGTISLKIEGGVPYVSDQKYVVRWTTDSGGTLIAENRSDANGVFTSTIQNLPKGNYTVEIQDGNYNTCTITSSMNLAEPQPLRVSLQNTRTVNCFGEQTGELIAHARGGVTKTSGLPYIYQWYKVVDGASVYIEQQNDSILTNLPAGIYKVKITDGSALVNVVESSVFEITQPTLQLTELKTRMISCFNGSDGFIHLSASGGTGKHRLFYKKHSIDTDYREMMADVTGHKFYLNNLASGTYSVYIQDENKCYAQINGKDVAEIVLTQPAKALTILSNSIIEVSGYGLANGQIRIDMDGGTPLSGGAYTVVWKDMDGNILPPSNSMQAGKYTSVLSQLKAGKYSVEIRDANYAKADALNNTACIASQLYEVKQPAKLSVEIEETHYISCNGDADGQLVAHADGGIKNSNVQQLPYKYTWYKQEGTTYTLIKNETDSVLNNLVHGVYRVNIEDYGRLTNKTEITYLLIQPHKLEATTKDVHIVCGQTATISVDVKGGTAPYTYLWNTGNTEQMLENVHPGKYMVFIKDSRGCETTASLKVLTTNGLGVAGVTKDPICYQSSTGSITSQVKGGTAPYTYRWNTGATAKDLLNIKAGIYTLLVTDKDGCSLLETFQLKDPTPLKIDLGGDKILCSGQSYALAPTVKDAKTIFNWRGSNGFTSTQSSVVLTQAGTYKVTITDSNGCVATDEVEVRVTDYTISSEMVVATDVVVNDTIVMVNISTPEADRIEWLISEDDAIEIVETSPYLAKIIFKQTGKYSIGMRSHLKDCFQDILKTVSVTETGGRNIDDFGQTDIKEFIVYPNPNDGVFKAKIGLAKEGSIRLRMFTLHNGGIVDDRTLTGQRIYEVDYAKSLPAGTYVLLLETASGKRSVKVIVR
ncbi:MAG: hypothetical protein RL662_1482 [Bacteroidota bacterium]|jgi:hypothetical protein